MKIIIYFAKISAEWISIAFYWSLCYIYFHGLVLDYIFIILFDLGVKRGINWDLYVLRVAIVMEATHIYMTSFNLKWLHIIV